MPRNSSAARIRLARPRVDMISSPVATKVGHMVGVCFEAAAAAVALFQIGDERAVARRKGQLRHKGQGQLVARAHAADCGQFCSARRR